MPYVAGDFVQVSLTLLSVDGEDIPANSGDQRILRSLELGSLHKEALDNFISSEVLSLGTKAKKHFCVEGDLFFPPYRDDLLCKIPRTNVDKDIKEGELIQNDRGNVGHVADTKNEEYLLVDFNHPFANKLIEFDLEILGKSTLSTSPSCSLASS